MQDQIRDPDRPQREQPNPDPKSLSGISGCGRQAGKAVLKDVIHGLRKQAHALQVICDMLPEVPTIEQDEMIWYLACSLKKQTNFF